jgi:hypothetical protein
VRLLTLLTLVVWSASAQQPRALLEEARQAFMVIELDQSRALALRVLNAGNAATVTERASALMLLGTIAVLQNRPGESQERFLALLTLLPTFTPDTLITPSEPLQAFRRARESVKATVVDAPSVQRGVGMGTPFRATVRVSSLHHVTVVILDAAGDTVDVLWSAPVAEAAAVTWNPRAVDGTVTLVSASLVQNRVLREVRIPLELTVHAADTLALPVPPQLAAVVSSGPRNWRPLAAGLGAAAAVLLAPIALGSEAGAPARLLVSVGLGAGGVVAYWRSATKGDAEVAAANARARAVWEQERRERIEENLRRRAQVTVDVRASAATRVERTP